MKGKARKETEKKTNEEKTQQTTVHRKLQGPASVLSQPKLT